MKIKSLICTVLSMLMLGLTGCGGGGGGGPAPGTVTVSGIASDGPIRDADISIYHIDSGQVIRAKSLVTGKTAADGSYSLTILPADAPTGPILVEVTGGTYTDDLSGTAGLALKTTLRAIVSSVADKDKISVTPLTELAYKRVEGIGTFTAVNIDDSNVKIGQTFGVDNIIRSVPFNAKLAAPGTATADDKRYAAAMGIFAQMVTDNKGTQALNDAMKTTMDALSAQVHDKGGFSVASVQTYNAARIAFQSVNLGGTVPAAISFKSGVLTLATTGTLAQGTAINGIDLTITLPTGVTIKADNLVNGEITPGSGVLVPSSQGLTNSLIIGHYTPPSGTTPGSVRVIVANVQPGLAIGEFAHLNFDGFNLDGTFTVTINQISGSTSPTATTADLPGINITNEFSGL